MRTDELDYILPPELIATEPVQPRDAARMMVVSRNGREVTHAHVRDLPRFLKSRDALVMNETAVLPARFAGRRRATGGRVEGLFLEEPATGCWRVMLRSNGRLSPGTVIDLDPPSRGGEGRCSIRLDERSDAVWIVQVQGEGDARTVLDSVGHVPLPPYILRARGDQIVDDALDRAWYQTVYANKAHAQSVAAPTAGLHFTSELLDHLREGGVRTERLILHVGAGTFQPVQTERLEDHEMHEEHFIVPRRVLRDLSEVGSAGGRVIAVGTTTVRALESVSVESPEVLDDSSDEGLLSGATRLMITPPYEFRRVDGMLTNFHLPRSTLLALLGAMVGLERLMELYEIAIRERYRFYSYGDCMLILP